MAVFYLIGNNQKGKSYNKKMKKIVHNINLKAKLHQSIER